MAFHEFIRLNLSLTERDRITALIDEKLATLTFGDTDFSALFRIRDRMAGCRVYQTERKRRSDSEN